jgi:hypothetical protein
MRLANLHESVIEVERSIQNDGRHPGRVPQKSGAGHGLMTGEDVSITIAEEKTAGATIRRVKPFNGTHRVASPFRSRFVPHCQRI